MLCNYFLEILHVLLVIILSFTCLQNILIISMTIEFNKKKLIDVVIFFISN